MKSDEVCKLLNISETTLRKYCNQELIRKINSTSEVNDYNEDDVQKVLVDQEKKIDDRKIVLINPEKQCIEKIYNNIDEVITDLKINKWSIYNCLTHDTNTCSGFILKYKKDATYDNIKIYSSKLNDRLALKNRKIVLIDPKKCSVEKVYNDKNEVITDLKIGRSPLKHCLSHETNTCNGYILKYLEDVTDDNIVQYSSKHNKALDGTIRCFACKEWHDPINIKNCYCVQCDRKRSDDYNNSYDGFFSSMAIAIKESAKRRLEKGREGAGICTINEQDLKEMYEEQRGECYYSGLKMTAMPKSEWQASPERLDEGLGYTKENTRLICLEFNVGYQQWNKSKINSLKTLCNEDADIDELKKKIEDAKNIVDNKIKTYQKRKIEIVDDIKYYECTKCHQMKTVSNFRLGSDGKPNAMAHCNKCRNERRAEYNNRFRGFLLNKLDSAKNNAKTRQKRQNGMVHTANSN